MAKWRQLKENPVHWVCDTLQNTPSGQMRLSAITQVEFAHEERALACAFDKHPTLAPAVPPSIGGARRFGSDLSNKKNELSLRHQCGVSPSVSPLRIDWHEMDLRSRFSSRVESVERKSPRRNLSHPQPFGTTSASTSKRKGRCAWCALECSVM